MEETLQTLRFLVGIGPPLLLFFVILVIVLNVLLPKYLPSTSFLEAPLLLLVMNTLFLSIIPFVVALIALRGYIEDGSANLLFFGCGMLSFSLACFVAGWLGAQAQANANLTIHNTGVLLASLFNFLAGVTLYLRKSARKDGEKQKKNTGIFAYLGIVIFTAGLSFAALRGYTPAFSVPGSGPTLLREVVLIAATIFFGISCLLIVVFDRDRRSFFLSCYAVALALITVGLIALMTSKRANSPLSWLGRSVQFTAGIYFLAAVVAAVRAAWTNRWTVPDAIRDFLRPSEALYRDLVETATDAIIPISTSREILLWNTAAEQMFGYNRVEALRLVPSDLIDPEDSKRMFQEIEAGAVSGKGSYAGKVREVKALRKSGDEFPAELSFSSRQSGGGWVSTLIIRDITERKQAEQKLAAAHRQVQSIIDNTISIIYAFDLEERFLLANTALAELLNSTPEQMIGKRRHEFMSKDDADWHEANDRKVIETGKALEFEEHNQLKGHSITWLTTKFPLRDVQGRIYAVGGISADVSERKRAEEELQRQTLELQHLTETLEQRVKDRTAELERSSLYARSLIESSLDPLVTINSNGKIMDVNRATELDTGLTRQQLIGSDFSNYFTEPEKARKGYNLVFKDGFIRDYPLAIRHTSGRITDVLYNATVFKNGKGELQGVFAAARDITERKKAEEALKEKARELADLSAQLVSAQENERKRVSYDLHDNVWQMLVAIRFEIERLLSGQEGKDLALLQNRSKKVMQSMLDTVSKIRSMQGDLWPYVLDDIGLLATIDWYCREFEKTHSDLVIQKTSNATEAEIPSSAKIVIYRILQEALSNIAKHSHASHVTVGLMRKDQGFEFSVGDNGVGFDPEETLVKKIPWGGLGLLTIKARTELSGGVFRIESATGNGTTVRAEWPI